jgi:hypothetical protein
MEQRQSRKEKPKEANESSGRFPNSPVVVGLLEGQSAFILSIFSPNALRRFFKNARKGYACFRVA